MQTKISEQFINTPQGQEADTILRSCVHCGFCTATCPTYQLLGDELDSPRGRIYLIKQVLEGEKSPVKPSYILIVASLAAHVKQPVHPVFSMDAW